MESFTNGAKRKKRKTRKCLDEIRKRSRRTGQILYEKEDEMYPKNIQRCMITNNRLTLRMFPNAIQSKTITRPALLELEQKTNLNFDELVKGSNSTNVLYTQTTKRVRTPISDTDNNYEFFEDSHNSDKGELENSTIGIEKNDISSEDKNFELFSSMDEVIDKSPNSIGSPSASTMTSSSPQSLQEDNGYNLYEEFMSEVPACLQQNSRLIHEDVMKKTKMLLQNLFIESCYEECEDNILKCIKNDKPKNMYYTSREVVHKPMDYIRLSHMQHRSQFDNGNGANSGSGSASPSPSPGPRPSSSPSPPSDAPLSVVIQDTPDYAYYPHRLN